MSPKLYEGEVSSFLIFTPAIFSFEALKEKHLVDLLPCANQVEVLWSLKETSLEFFSHLAVVTQTEKFMKSHFLNKDIFLKRKIFRK